MDEYTKTAVARHERLIKQLKKKIATAQALHKSMPGKTVKQRKERDNVKYKMELELQNKASSLKTAPMNWYIMKAYAESGLPRIADVAKEYIENNDEPSDKPKKTELEKHKEFLDGEESEYNKLGFFRWQRANPKEYDKITKDLESGAYSDEVLQYYVDNAHDEWHNIAKERLKKYKDGVLIPPLKFKDPKRTGQPPLLKRLEAKKKNFSSAEAKLTHYYKKMRKEKLAKVKKSYAGKPDRIKIEMDYFDEDYGSESRNWSKRVKKLATAEKKIKKLRKLYIAFWKLGFDEKMLLHQFRVWEFEGHPRARSKSQTWGEERIPRNKLINEMSEILQEIREDENLDRVIKSIEKIENLKFLNEEKLSIVLLDDPETKDSYIKLRNSLMKTLFDIYQIYNKNLGGYDGGIVDWLDRPDDKIYKLKGGYRAQLAKNLFDDYIFDQATPF